MANVDKPHGFRPIYAIHGVSGTCGKYELAAANTAIGIGDLIGRTNAGVVDQAAATSVQVIGVAAEAKAANSGGTILLYDGPFQVYEAQTDDGTGTLTAQTGVNLNADFVATAASAGMSRMEIDENSGAVTPTLPLVVLGLYEVVDNAFGEFNRLEVMINNHVLKSLGTTGI